MDKKQEHYRVTLDLNDLMMRLREFGNEYDRQFFREQLEKLKIVSRNLAQWGAQNL